MANIPKPQSYEQIQGDMLSAYAAKMGIDDFNVGSAVTSFFEVVALTTARASGDVFQILRDYSIDRATGDALKRLAAENRVKLITAKPATGIVTVTDTSFKKVATKIYSGASSPNIGSLSVKISDSTGFPAYGSVYLGRGTANIEGPIPYLSITPVGGYFQLNLGGLGTTKFHNIGENVILSQGGNRSIPTNTIVVSPSSGATADVSFIVTYPSLILDGEVSVADVAVSAQAPGNNSNVPRGAIKSFSSPPFSGATVTNTLPFTTGKDSESDDQLRVRVKRQLASRGLGTNTAIKSAVIGASPSDETATITATEIQQSSVGTILYIDNGSGYESKSSGVGKEAIIDRAIGGEKFFQLATGGRQSPIAKAFLQSTFSSPFGLIGGDTLSITVGGQTFQHVFANSDFRSPGGVTAFEVTASVNANTAIGFEATTASGGQFVVFRAKDEGYDSLKANTPQSGARNAATVLGLPANEIQTLRLYKNKVPLSKDGKSATLLTQVQQLWSSTIANGETLSLAVDGTANITYTITDADFIATGLYTSVSATNSLESWQQVLNSKLTGVTVTIVGQQLNITSNLGASNRAKLIIDPLSTLVTRGMFSSLLGISSQGKASDYILSRNTGSFELSKALVTGDELTGGSAQTEARISSSQIPGGNISFADNAHLWLLIDSIGQIIQNGAVGNTVISVQKPSTNIIRYGSNITSAFTNVNVGDYVTVWSKEVDASVRLEGRVHAKTNSTFDVLVTPAEYAAAVTTNGVTFTEGIVFLRSENIPQKFKVSSGSKTLVQISDELQTQTSSLVFSVYQDQYLIIRSVTKDSAGNILVASMDAQGKLLSFTSGQTDYSKDSLIAFQDTQSVESEMPLFFHASFASGSAADPIDSYITSLTSDTSLSGRDPNDLIKFLHPYGAIADSQPAGETTQQTSISGSTIGITKQSDIRRVRSVDRYFLTSPLDFGSNDTVITVLDGDTSSKSFEIPLYRRATVNSTLVNNSLTFNAYDTDSGTTASFVTAFDTAFDFSNFKVLMQAKKVLKASNVNESAVLFKSTKWGRSGEKIKVSYIYPSSANSAIGGTVQLSETVDIKINLKSGASVVTTINSSTEWGVTIVPNVPSVGIDQVTYSHVGTGNSPGLTNVQGGMYVNIGATTELNKANTGTFRVSTQAGYTPGSNSFSVQRPSGAAVAETNKATIVSTAISFYNKLNTTALEINNYTNASLSDYLTASLTNDAGSTGSGVVTYSTYEDSGFTTLSYSLHDGINWIASSNISGATQFTLKIPLTLPSDAGYSFNAGEVIRLVPTTVSQVRKFTSVLSVTGVTTVGTVSSIDRGTRFELATNVLGSSGSIQIIGGHANKYEVPVLDSAVLLNSGVLVSTNKVVSQAMHSDQWFRLQASTSQRKDAFLSSNSSVSIISNVPTAGQSTIKLSGKNLNQRYFGKPRHHVRVKGRTFRIEKQGILTCLSWNGSGTSPAFSKSALNFNATSGTINVSLVTGTSESEYRIMTGTARFSELSIGDKATISGLPVSVNNGTFLVTGVSSDGKSLRVLNSKASKELSRGSFTLNTNVSTSDSFTIDTTTLVAGTHFAIGSTANQTAINLSAVIGTITGVSSSVSANVVTVTSTINYASVSLSHSGPATVVTAQMVGDSYSSSTFAASSEVSEGDTVTIGSPFVALNQGNFRVIRRYNDSIWYENSNVIAEEVVMPNAYISLFVSSTTSLKVIATNGSQYVNWNGSLPEPFLGNARMGDVMTFGSDFLSSNQGEFMVTSSGAKLQQVTQFAMPAGSQFATSGPGKYFLMNSAGDATSYYVWFNVNGATTNPSVSGLTAIQVSINSSDSAITVALKAALAIDSSLDFDAASASDVLTVTTAGYIETTSAANFNMPSPFSVSVTQLGRRTFLECINPSASNESSVLVSGIFTCNRPQIKFSEYEATNVGDQFVATGDTLNTSNAGLYTIVDVIDTNTVVVSGSMASVTNISLNGRESTVFVQEGILYSGYKQVSHIAIQPGAPTRNGVVFNTSAQYEKINESASVQIVSLNKLNFNTVIRKGLDAYRYNTGLIAEANRIIYGDPRDSESYPGVGAAGAEIYVREPLIRRIKLSMDVRIATGVPFSQIAEQIRTIISSLINSNDVGQSISISSIISSVNGIPGAKAVAISSPQYDSTHDIIFLAPSEKARIIDPALDISVSQIGQ